MRAAFIGTSWQKHAAIFRGWWDFKVWRDFEEIRYTQECVMLMVSAHIHDTVCVLDCHHLATKVIIGKLWAME